MAEGDVRQLFVRNEAGTVWGPLAPSTIELLLANGVMKGRLEVSEDGVAFAPPGHFPAVRELIPRLWSAGAAPSPAPSPAIAPPPPAAHAPPPASVAPAPADGARPDPATQLEELKVLEALWLERLRPWGDAGYHAPPA